MPITPAHPTRRISQEEFGAMAYDVMQQVFAIHNEFGRFFDEKIYKRELAARIGGIALEFPITEAHGDFSKVYCLDVLLHEAGLFEFKSAEAIHPRHRGQTINYLLLADLAHAKIVNVRPEDRWQKNGREKDDGGFDFLRVHLLPAIFLPSSADRAIQYQSSILA